VLFSLYEAVQRREELVVTLDALAGAPPSGVQILETAAAHDMRDELIKTFDIGEDGRRPCSRATLPTPLSCFFGPVTTTRRGSTRLGP